MSGLEASRQFWDEKARENPYWYVSSAGPYEGRNLAEFWASGPKIWNDLKSASGYQPKRIDTVVEIGCGVGRLTRAIAPEVGRVFAFDLSAEMLTIARSVEADNASFHRAETSGTGGNRGWLGRCVRRVLRLSAFARSGGAARVSEDRGTGA
jgi:SAM-dependent methyltransferase